MAKPIECIIEVDEWGAKRLMESLLHPKKDPVRDKMIEDAKNMRLEVR